MKTLLPKPKSIKHAAKRGIALVTTLLLLVMLSALAVAFVLAVNTENRIQSTDKGETKAYYGAEAGMEKMISDLNGLYQSKASPSVADIQGLGVAANYPSVTGINYREFAYAVTAAPAPNNTMPNQYSSTVASGPNEGLIASIIPIGLAVTADTSAKEEVRMTRQVEVALIPVFQFGVFSDPDLSFFAGPTMEVTGRVQTNGDLYITPGGTTTFLDKVRTARELVRDTLANGVLASAGHTGPAFIPTSPNGCSGAQPACRQLSLPANEGSWQGGSWPYFVMPSINPPVPGNPVGTQNPGWSGIKNAYGPFVFTFVDGVQPLKLPFVGPGVSSIEILRQPLASDNSVTSTSRLYNKAQIRVLLTDDPAELPGGAGNPQNIRLANVAPFAASGVPLVANPPGCIGVAPACNMYFAEGTDALNFPPPVPPSTPGVPDPNWVLPNADTSQPPNVVNPLYAPGPPTTNKWNLLDGWLRVEYRNAAGAYVPVTQEWLKLGFARDFNPPTGPFGTPGANTVNPRAILIFQEKAARQINPPSACPPYLTTDANGNCAGGAVAVNNYYPISMYDSREGEPRELTGNDGCTVNGIMNVTEIDVGNLKQWLQGTFGGSGTTVESATENGYILYFSDHRGMQKNTSGFKRGAYGFEDVINPASAVGTPNGGLPDPGEDVEQPGDVGAGVLEWQGSRNVGLGFGFNVDDLKDGSAIHPDSVFTRINVVGKGGCHVGRANWVSGARHAVRLIDGAPGAGGATNLPLRPVNNSPDPTNVGGFTLATDNAAYIKGDYNMNAATCPSCILSPPVAPPYPGNYPHASAAVLADTVTLLSNGWNDMESFISPGTVNSRPASTTYYRVAIASGKGVNFSQPAYGGGVAPIGGIPGPGDATGGLTTNPPGDFGTDGGDHNFLRYLENWGGQDSAYVGSRVTLYFSQYATGTFKCCGTVYSPPARKYIFDLDFLRIQIVPPGTPRFQEIINVGYKQDVNYR